MIDCQHWSATARPSGGLCAIGKGGGRPSAGFCRFCLAGGNMDTAPVQSAVPARRIPSGPGTELKKILASFGIKASSCGCNSHARQMDAWGPDKCAAEADTIIGWLTKESKGRGWHLPAFVARLALSTAIQKARNASAGTASASPTVSEPSGPEA